MVIIEQTREDMDEPIVTATDSEGPSTESSVPGHVSDQSELKTNFSRNPPNQNQLP